MSRESTDCGRGEAALRLANIKDGQHGQISSETRILCSHYHYITPTSPPNFRDYVVENAEYQNENDIDPVGIPSILQHTSRVFPGNRSRNPQYVFLGFFDTIISTFSFEE